MNDQKINTIVQRLNRVQKAWWMAFAFFIGFAGYPSAVNSQTCTPASAKICVAADDDSTIYVGGTLIGQIGYCNWDGTGSCPPGCLSVPTALLTGAQVCLAIETQNTAPLINYSSWDLDITCAGGNHSEITSDNGGGGLSLYYTPNGNPSTPPAADGSGNPWFSPSYNPTVSPFTFTPTAVLCAETWGQPIYNPVSGAQLTFQSNSCSADTGGSNITGALFWRECVPIPTPAPTLGPTAFTITKSIIGGPVYNIPGANDASVTYAITYCNTGAAVTTPVTIQDNISGGGMQYGSGCIPPPSQPQPYTPYCGGNGSVIYPLGMPGNFCQSVTFTYINYYYPNDFCATFVNNATIGDGVVSTTSNSVTANLVCATNTFTYTPTYTYSPTFTRTPTPTWSNTPPPSTLSPTNTYTWTPSYTPTPTWSNTVLPGTSTATNTYTFTPSYTPTSTATAIATATAGAACGAGGSGVTTPNLTLGVRQGTCGNTELDYYFYVVNNGSTAVSVADICFEFWAYDTAATSWAVQSDSTGNIYNTPYVGSPGGSFTLTATKLGTPCTVINGTVTTFANWEFMICDSSATTSIAPGNYWIDGEIGLYDTTYSYTPGEASWYSPLPGGVCSAPPLGGGASDVAAYFNIPQYALLYNGQLVNEGGGRTLTQELFHAPL